MSLVAGIRVACDVRCPFMFGGVCVTSADILVLKRFQLLLGAKFVGLVWVLVRVVPVIM